MVWLEGTLQSSYGVCQIVEDHVRCGGRVWGGRTGTHCAIPPPPQSSIVSNHLLLVIPRIKISPLSPRAVSHASVCAEGKKKLFPQISAWGVYEGMYNSNCVHVPMVGGCTAFQPRAPSG